MTNDLAWLRPKLAELCGLAAQGRYYVRADTVPLYAIDFKKYPSDEVWRPDEDVAQAIRCLEVFSKKEHIAVQIILGHRWTVILEGGMRIYEECIDKSLPYAICRVIASASEWEKP